MNKFLITILAIFLQSCNGNMMSGFTNSNTSNETQENYEEYSMPTSQLNKTRELLDGASINFPTLTATGYAVVSTQPGQNVEQKMAVQLSHTHNTLKFLVDKWTQNPIRFKTHYRQNERYKPLLGFIQENKRNKFIYQKYN